jgi:mRNA-degrading endonuclease RelE of RelBE toxin-antitoxin system
LRRQLNQRIMRFKEDPHPTDAESLCEKEKYRLRVQGWRILCEVDVDRRLVTVWAVRKD